MKPKYEGGTETGKRLHGKRVREGRLAREGQLAETTIKQVGEVAEGPARPDPIVSPKRGGSGTSARRPAPGWRPRRMPPIAKGEVESPIWGLGPAPARH